MFRAATRIASRTSGSSSPGAAATASGSTRSDSGTASPRPSATSRSPASPPLRTLSTIRSTSAAHLAERRRQRSQPARERRRVASVPLDALDPHWRRRLPQPLGQRVHLAGAQLVGHAVGDQAGRAAGDLLAHLELVLGQRPPGVDEVHDPVGEPDDRRQLDRPLDLDHLGLATRLLEVALRRARVLGRDPHRAQAALRLAEALVALAAGEHHPAGPVAQVEKLVDGAVALLEQHVLAGDAEIGGAGLHVGGDVRGTHRDQHQPIGSEDQRARLSAQLAGVRADPVEQVERALEQRPPRHGELQRPAGARPRRLHPGQPHELASCASRCSSACAMCSRSR